MKRELNLLPHQCMKLDSNDVKVLVGQIVMYLCDTSEDRLTGRFQGDASLVPALVVGTKEKNTLVRTCCEGALLSILKLRHGEETYQVSRICEILSLISLVSNMLTASLVCVRIGRLLWDIENFPLYVGAIIPVDNWSALPFA